jgi:hypothetical protein
LSRRSEVFMPQSVPLFTSWALYRVVKFFVVLCLATNTLHAVAQSNAKKVTGSPQKSGAKVDSANLLNKAYKQPMLAERVTKAFLMINLKALPTRSRTQMEESLAAFARAQQELLRAAPTTEIRENYELLDQLFEEYREIKSRPATAQSAAAFAEQNEELVWIAQKGAALLEAHSKSTRNELVATAGEARTLTQRIAKLYLFRASGIRSAVIANDLKKAELDYRNAITKLLATERNTTQIKERLALAETQWIFLRSAIVTLNANQNSLVELEHVSKACDNIAVVLEEITTLYERL